MSIFGYWWLRLRPLFAAMCVLLPSRDQTSDTALDDTAGIWVGEVLERHAASVRIIAVERQHDRTEVTFAGVFSDTVIGPDGVRHSQWAGPMVVNLYRSTHQHCIRACAQFRDEDRELSLTIVADGTRVGGPISRSTRIATTEGRMLVEIGTPCDSPLN